MSAISIYEIRLFDCPYCNLIFKMAVGKLHNDPNSPSKHSNITATIPCLRCKNFLKIKDSKLTEEL